MQCDGCGYCLTVNNIVCMYDCKLKKCSNYTLCGNKSPFFLLDFNRGVCNECISKFGKCVENPTTSDPKLKFSHTEMECPVCLQNVKLSVKNPRCSHYICLSCIKAIYWIEYEIPEKPEFPHPDKENEYYENPEWFLNDESVNDWKKKLGSWNEKRLEYIVQNKKYLKHCPLCRL